MRLTIGIATIPERIDKLKRLLDSLLPQIGERDVQIIYYGDNKYCGLGKKRMEVYYAANSSNTNYLVFIDDDDEVSPDYISEIYKAMETEPDLINFKMEVRLFTGEVKIAEFSKDYINEDTETGYRRKSHTLMCWKYSVLHPKYYAPNDMLNGEDTYFAYGMNGRAQTEVNIDKVLYYYNTWR